jgi:hypothetical protein
MSPLIRCSHARPARMPAGHQDPARNTTPAHHARPADAKTPNPDEGSGCPQCPETSHGGAKGVELRGFEPLTFCMPCSRVSSDDVVLGPVTALQSSSNVWGRLAWSGEIWGHTGRPPARCLWVRSFSGGPRSEPDGRLSAHPALQRLSRAVRGWLPPAACTQDSRRRFGVLHYAYLPAPESFNRLAPFALRAAFPPSLAGRYSRDYYGASVTAGLASRTVIPRSSLSYVLARPRLPVRLLGCPRWASPRHWRCARTQRHAGAVPGTGVVRLSGGGKVLPRLEIRVQAIQL